jgi:mono/diheme cytochrome c family protein
MKRLAPLAVLLSALVLAGCPGDADQPAPEPRETAAPVASPAAPAAVADLPPGVSAEMVAQGQELYATVCVACHGAAGTGTPLGPSLNDADWIHIGGDFEEIVRITTEGVARPARYPAPMPPAGGGNFDEAQLRAISAYVYSLSRG